MQNQRRPVQVTPRLQEEYYSGRKYEVDYVYNGFWLGGFKKGKIEGIMNSRAKKGWHYVGMESHSSVFLLLFRRTSIIMTFYKDF